MIETLFWHQENRENDQCLFEKESDLFGIAYTSFRYNLLYRTRQMVLSPVEGALGGQRIVQAEGYVQVCKTIKLGKDFRDSFKFLSNHGLLKEILTEYE